MLVCLPVNAWLARPSKRVKQAEVFVFLNKVTLEIKEYTHTHRKREREKGEREQNSLPGHCMHLII